MRCAPTACRIAGLRSSRARDESSGCAKAGRGDEAGTEGAGARVSSCRRRAALPLRCLAVRRRQPRPRRPAACARAGPRSAPGAARGRARARARRPRRHRRLQSGEPVGNAPDASAACAARLGAAPARAVPAARRRVHRLSAPARLAAPAELRGRGGPLRLLHPAGDLGASWLARFGWMEAAGDRWWPVFGALYYIVAVKRVRGMRLVGLVRDEARPRRSTAPAPVGATPARASAELETRWRPARNR